MIFLYISIALFLVYAAFEVARAGREVEDLLSQKRQP